MMEVIEEQSKCDEDSIIPPRKISSDNLRICLVGNVCDDKNTVNAAKKIGVPVITSETATDIILDDVWVTYFILNNFEGAIYEAIKKTKHKILGPPALHYIANSNMDLPSINRPLYNYSMKGVVTCFTGIRKKDELTELVNLIHSMGGSIRKDMNSKVTHLICNATGGKKYEYAMTFRLAVVRPDWVHEAWKNKESYDFKATEESFTKEHKLKVFEGQRICLFGFSADEYQHMVDVLTSNKGIVTDLEDPECTHVVMANMGDHFPEIAPGSQCSSPAAYFNFHGNGPPKIENAKDVGYKIDNDLTNNMSDVKIQAESTSTVDELDRKMIECSDILMSEKGELSTITENSTPKHDGVILSSEKNEFLDPNNLSPILKTPKSTKQSYRLFSEDNLNSEINQIKEEGEDSACQEYKRKQESFDNVSILSTDSIEISSTGVSKKLKLIRTGSITRSIKRSMSFATVKTPIANMLRPRRNSVDPNSSISSITSTDSKFNESIKNPVKDKLRTIRDRVRKGSKRDINITPKTAKLASSNLITLKKLCKLKATSNVNDEEIEELMMPESSEKCFQIKRETDFKTPSAPQQRYCSDLPTQVKQQTPSPTNEAISNYEEISQKDISTIEAPQKTEKRLESYSKSHTGSIDSSSSMDVDSVITKTTSTSVNIAVDENIAINMPEPKSHKTHIVKADWFWYTIQNGYADETLYLFGDYLDSIANTPGTDSHRDSLPISFKRKRKRFLQRLLPDKSVIGTNKRRSSITDGGLLSASNSFLDYTVSPDKYHDSGVCNKTTNENDVVVEPSPKNRSMRYNHFMDFYNTESNYVGILSTVKNIFKTPLEERAETNDALLNKSEVKAIFGNFTHISDVHKSMLERLKELQSNWKEDCLIGQIILDHRNELIKAYPPYINFFEQMKDTLLQCDKENPRFHAFLKINQAKPECGRQSLQDLMIRPVQRLPSISLLISDILKHTNKNNPDHKKLEDALRAIKEVMAHINEDKRKTEGQLAIFDIFNDIEQCPAHLVSANRCFISKCEVTELSDSLSGRGDSLILYLFSDTIEVCKKRSRGFNAAKSPSSTKSSKHIKLMPLTSIRYVIEIFDSPKAFAINCRHNQENKDKLYAFMIDNEEIDRTIYLRNLCKQVAEHACRTDINKALISMTSQELDVDTNDIHLSTLSKAFKFATRTRLKVGRAFSFNKTPAKLKRAVSTMMPTHFGSTHSLTPASQFAQMRLASCTNLNEIGEKDGCDQNNHNMGNNRSQSPSTQSEVLVAPMSVHQIGKNKNSTISLAALRRL
ncbi:protein ECT2 [Condylostylus longicornis]|uniref:protein ECT2 n=1 Tax=Condylostylus longicornis TaxID=2530218 RepID=UPI00244E1E08|nr:protein ECT2 [Condylostylus longicornis]